MDGCVNGGGGFFCNCLKSPVSQQIIQFAFQNKECGCVYKHIHAAVLCCCAKKDTVFMPRRHNRWRHKRNFSGYPLCVPSLWPWYVRNTWLKIFKFDTNVVLRSEGRSEVKVTVTFLQWPLPFGHNYSCPKGQMSTSVSDIIMSCDNTSVCNREPLISVIFCFFILGS